MKRPSDTKITGFISQLRYVQVRIGRCQILTILRNSCWRTGKNAKGSVTRRRVEAFPEVEVGIKNGEVEAETNAVVVETKEVEVEEGEVEAKISEALPENESDTVGLLVVLGERSPIDTGMYLRQVLSTLRQCSTRQCKLQVRSQPQHCWQPLQ